MNNVFKKLTTEESCMRCSNGDDEIEKVDYKIQPERISLLKAQKNKLKKIEESDIYCKAYN